MSTDMSSYGPGDRTEKDQNKPGAYVVCKTGSQAWCTHRACGYVDRSVLYDPEWHKARAWDEGVDAAFRGAITRQNSNDVKRSNPYRVNPSGRDRE